LPDRLDNEATEIHSYVRHAFQLLVTWLTFFGTANMVGIGWFVSVADSFEPWAVVLIGVFFVVQAAIGSVACTLARSMFVNSQERLHEIDMIQHDDVGHRARAPIGPLVYARVTWVITGAVASLGAVWLVLLART